MGILLECWGKCYEMGYRHLLGSYSENGELNFLIHQHKGLLEPERQVDHKWMSSKISFSSGTLTCPACGYEALVKTDNGNVFIGLRAGGVAAYPKTDSV